MERNFITTHCVRSYELDSFGHVNNAVYLNYLEYARTEYLLQNGLSFKSFEKWNAIPFVVRADIHFKSSARVHDELEILGKITQWRRSSFVIHYEVVNKTTDRVAAVADMAFAFVNRDERIVPIPNEFKKRLGP